MRRLPPLKAVRPFEAAARHLSLSRAADEQHVTQATVSHQIKALEEWLGVTLFWRQTRGVLLTDAGQAYLPALTGALDAIDRATRDLLRRDRAGILTISALASFAAKWLVPRLGRVVYRHPNISVRIAAEDSLVDFAQREVDLAIRYSHGA